MEAAGHIVTGFFLLVPKVLGHASLKNEEVAQAKSGGQQSKVIEQ